MSQKANITLYLGGIRSGKSYHAEYRAKAHGRGPVIYVATADKDQNDPSMQARIDRHTERRPEHWQTLECPMELGKHLAKALEDCGLDNNKSVEDAQHSKLLPPDCPTILIDCVTLWVSNILLSQPDPLDILAIEKIVAQEVDDLLQLTKSTRCRWIIVSSETGLGGIAQSPIERVFNDALGLANRRLARAAKRAFLIVAGRFLRLEELE